MKNSIMKNPSYYMCLIYYLLLPIYSAYKTFVFFIGKY